MDMSGLPRPNQTPARIMFLKRTFGESSLITHLMGHNEKGEDLNIGMPSQFHSSDMSLAEKLGSV